MKGTEKQVGWATSIKKETLEILDNIFKNMLDLTLQKVESMYKTEEKREMRKERMIVYYEKAINAIEEIKNNNDAKFFIDNFKVATYDKIGSQRKASEILSALFKVAKIHEQLLYAELMQEVVSDMYLKEKVKELKGFDNQIELAENRIDILKLAIKIAEEIAIKDKISEEEIEEMQKYAKKVMHYVERQDDAQTIANYLSFIDIKRRNKVEQIINKDERERRAFFKSIANRLYLLIES